MDYEHGYSCVCYSRITFNVVVIQINDYHCIIFVSVKDIIRKYILNMLSLIELLLKLYILVYYAVQPNTLSNMSETKCIPYYYYIPLCITCGTQQLYSPDVKNNIFMKNNYYYKSFCIHIYMDAHYNIKNKTYINKLKNVYYDSKYIEYLNMYTASRDILVINTYIYLYIYLYKVECLIFNACINLRIIYITFVYFDNLIHVNCKKSLLIRLNIPLPHFIRSPSKCKIKYIIHTRIEAYYRFQNLLLLYFYCVIMCYIRKRAVLYTCYGYIFFTLCLYCVMLIHTSFFMYYRRQPFTSNSYYSNSDSSIT